MPATKTLYDEDFVRWSEEQSRALREAARSGVNLPLDWENLAEEVESLGRSQRRELRSRIAVILEHLRGSGPHVRGCWVVDHILDLR